jgi:trehalose 6-phosphate synthase
MTNPALANAGDAVFDFIVVSNRLPVETGPDGTMQWAASAGGLVTALQPVMAKTGGAWVGWAGDTSGSGPADAVGPGAPAGRGPLEWLTGNEPSHWWEDTGAVPVLPAGAGRDAATGEAWGPDSAPESAGVHALPVSLSEDDLDLYYQGFCNATLWPLYHDVTALPVYSRRWWHRYVEVNERFSDVVSAHAAPGATVWAHDYHLQLLPAMLRQARPDLRIGFFNHIPFPPYELFAQLPWRREVVEGLLGADLVGFQTADGAQNFLGACRRLSKHSAQRSAVSVAGPGGGERLAQVGAFPISVDAEELCELAQRPEIAERARQIREEVGNPEILLLGVDRLDYTKGILHRLRAYGELLKEDRLGPPKAVLVQIASPSRGEVEEYQRLREEVERVVGSINGDFSPVGHPAVHYLHQSFPREEMAAMYLAADVALVTPLRDGMNLVAKEYVACRYDHRGRLVLSEFTGAADELTDAFLVNPHDIDSLKSQVMSAVQASEAEAGRRMQAMRKQVFNHNVHDWANEFLGALEGGLRHGGRERNTGPAVGTRTAGALGANVMAGGEGGAPAPKVSPAAQVVTVT